VGPRERRKRFLKYSRRNPRRLLATCAAGLHNAQRAIEKATADIKRARTLRIATARQRGIAVLRQSVYEQMPEAAEQFLASTTIRLLSFMFSSHARIGAINLIRLDDFLNANKPNVSFVRCFEIFLARTRP
jgi:hypothetical protein